MPDVTCWRSECSTGCYYPGVCSEHPPAPQARPVEQEIAAVLAAHDYVTDDYGSTAQRDGKYLDSGHLDPGWHGCRCGRWSGYWSDYRAHVAAAVAPLIARERAAAAKEALQETAEAWQTGQWADAPRRADRVQERLANAQHVTDWLRDRADRIGGDPT